MPEHDELIPGLTPEAAAEVNRWVELQAILDEVFNACEGPAETLQVARDALVQSAAAHVKAIRQIDGLLKEQAGAAAP